METEKISQTLDTLCELYDTKMDSSQLDNTFELSMYCKIAILEFCGWFEETRRDFIKEILNKKIEETCQVGKDKTLISKLAKKHIKVVHGVSYDDHFENVISNIFGVSTVLKLRDAVPKIDILLTIMKDFHEHRGRLAHTQYQNFNLQNKFNSPSLVRQKFNNVKEILEKIFQFLKAESQ